MMGKSVAESDPLQAGGKLIEISIETGAPVTVQPKMQFQGKKTPQKHLKSLHSIPNDPIRLNGITANSRQINNHQAVT